ncbi:5-(carboxyamino)imidazole ribonucleotide mutase [bacterium]|nr:5-(carboxyamino)imidazole ribonucleotide mutase [bacterium]
MTNTEGLRVAILMGSASDWDVMQHSAKTLSEFGVSNEARVLSAHRVPEAVAEYVKTAPQRGTKVFIAAAGMAAHLAGAVAANTVLPVIGVPLASGALNGVDALYSTVMMPPGIPVGTVAVGKPGAINAALLAISILGTSDPALLQKLTDYRRDNAAKILATELPAPV